MYTLAVMVDDIEDKNLADGMLTTISDFLSCLGLSGSYAIVKQDDLEEEVEQED